MLNIENEKSKATLFYTDWSVIQIEFVRKNVYPNGIPAYLLA